MDLLLTKTMTIAFLANGSLSDRMRTASLNTIIGLGIVFAVLILIFLLISSFKIIPYLEKKSAKPVDKDPIAVDNVITQLVEKEEISLSEDYELVAVITAAIYASLGDSVPSDGLVVRSIRKVNSRGWKNA